MKKKLFILAIFILFALLISGCVPSFVKKPAPAPLAPEAPAAQPPSEEPSPEPAPESAEAPTVFRVQINTVPKEVSNLCAPAVVEFSVSLLADVWDPESEGNEFIYEWDRNDPEFTGTMGRDVRNFTHTYKKPGTYLVKLTVTHRPSSEQRNAYAQVVVKSCVMDTTDDVDDTVSTTPPTDTTITADTAPTDTTKVSEAPKNLRAYANVAHVSPDTSDIACEAPPSYGIFAAFRGSMASDISTGTYTYHWDFGDGQSADGKDFDYGYEVTSVGPWRYTAALTVTHKESNTKATATAVVNIPCKQKTATIPETITPFIRASRESEDTANKYCTEVTSATYSFLGGVVESIEVNDYEYAWNFGDGHTGTGSNVTHTYNVTGEGPWEYAVSMTATRKATDKKASTSTKINIPCEKKQIEVSLDSALTSEKSCAPASYGFTAAVTSSHADGTQYTYAWNFGNGASSAGPTTVKTNTASRTYENVAVYTAKVTVTGKNLKAGEAKKTFSVPECEKEEVIEQMEANINKPANNATVCLADDVQFEASVSASGIASGLTYSWNFGDGKTGQGKNATHSYTNVYPCPGNVTVTVTAIDSATGVQAQKSHNLIVDGCGRCDALGVAYLESEGYTYNSSLVTTPKATNTILVPYGQYNEEGNYWEDLYVNSTVGQGPIEKDVIFYIDSSDSDYYFRAFSYPSGCVDPYLRIVQGYSASLFSLRANNAGVYKAYIRKIDQTNKQYGPVLTFVWTATAGGL